jgi:phosphatidylglycerol:prolipoprotein diacylglycerol transferase
MIPFLHLGPTTIPTYGLMVATAMIFAYFVLRADFARRGIAKGSESNLAELFIAVPCICGIIGARLYHVLETPRELLADPWGQRIPLLVSLDAGSPAAALGYGIGRLGCFLSGDGDYGIPTRLHWPFGMAFPNGLVPTTQTCTALGWPTNCRVYPTPLLEFLIGVAISWFLWRLARVRLAAHSTYRSAGFIFGAYLILTGIVRFLVEFIRINPRSFMGMTNAQVASLISIVAGSVFIVGVGHRSSTSKHRTIA